VTDGGERDRECGRLEQPAGKREADRGGQPPGARSDALDVFEEVLQSIGDPGLDRRRRTGPAARPARRPRSGGRSTTTRRYRQPRPIAVTIAAISATRP